MNLVASKRALLAGIVWVAIGLFLAVRGLLFWEPTQLKAPGWAIPALAIGLVVGAAKGFFVLRKSAKRMIARIEKVPGPAPFWQMYPSYLYAVIPLMIGVGIALRHFCGESYPSLVLGVYVGIGAALIGSAGPFFAASRRLAAG